MSLDDRRGFIVQKIEEKKVIFRIDRQLADRFKAFCALEGITQNDMFLRILNEFMQRKDNKYKKLVNEI